MTGILQRQHVEDCLGIAASQPLLDRTLAWAAINSGTANLDGLASLASLLADDLARLPGKLCLVEADAIEDVSPDGSRRAVERGRNIHLTVRDHAPLQLLLTGHMDTVFGIDHPFQECRFLGDGRVNGPGVADMKGGIAIMFAALAALEASPFRHNVGYEVVINSDEETGSGGSAALIRRAAKGKTAAFTYEPALRPEGLLASTRPGSANYSISIAGKAAHAGRNPEDGRNAVVAAADLALRLAAFAKPGITVNPARIDGGGPNNVVPDRAVLRANIRVATHRHQIHVEEHLGNAIRNVSLKHDVKVDLHGGFGRPPKIFDPVTRRLFALVKACGTRLGQNIEWMPSGGVCDGNNIAACGIPVVDTMGACGGAIHSSDEFVLPESLTERARLSALVFLQLAEQGRL